MTLPLSLQLYRAATRALAPVSGAYLESRARAGKEDPARWHERFTRSPSPRPTGELIWLHGASVGETRVQLQLCDELAKRRPRASFLVTTGTRTAAALFAQRARPYARHVYAPIDTPSAAARFLDHWKPDLGIFAESEIWPNLLVEADRRGVRMALINATLSAGARRRWSKLPKAARHVLGAFDLLLAAEAETAASLSALSGRQAARVGNLKFAAAPLPCDEDALTQLRSAIGARSVWLAASTHEGEDEILLAAHALLRAERPDALLILAPRHPERGARIAALAEDAPRRAQGEAIGAKPVYVADTLGELGLFYRAAPISLVAGSLLPQLEGHNPIEPAKLGSAILSGPHVASFKDAYDVLSIAGAARIVESAPEIAAAVGALWRDEAARTRLSQAALRAVDLGGADPLARTLDDLERLLDAHAPA